jgi:hypothetical protein
MKTMIIALMAVLCISGCKAQDKKKNIIKDEANQPKVSWKVNKEVDDKGNVIRYDSTYVWSYSNKGKAQNVDVDSVLHKFREQFDINSSEIFGRGFGGPVWNDSAFYKDFIRPDYFLRKWENNSFDMRRMMQQMDSMRNAFLKKNYPGINPESKKLQSSKVL